MNTTPELQEQIKAARAVLDAVERGEQVQWNDAGRDRPKWNGVPIEIVLDALSWYRVKPTPPPTPRFYTVAELIKAGARYLRVDTAVYTITYMSADANRLAIMINKHEDHNPCWFHHHDFKWSANGREWESFVKKD